MQESLLNKLRDRSALPWIFLVVATLVFSWIDLRGSSFGQFLAPALGDPMESGNFGRFAIGLVFAFAIAGNILLLRIFSFRTQVIIVWLELLMLALAFFNSFDLSYSFIASKLPFLITQGAFTTIYISLSAILIASILAMMAALGRLSSNGLAYGISSFYISFFRGTPLLLQVYLIYLGLPQMGIVVDAIPAGIAALALCYGAYMAEIFRAGITGIPKSQSEAAAALGLRKPVIFRKIVLPQAMRMIIPPTGNQFIAMLKDSSLISVMGIWELMFLARTQGRAEFKHLEMLVTAALVYWAMSIIFELVQARIEKHYGKGQTH